MNPNLIPTVDSYRDNIAVIDAQIAQIQSSQDLNTARTNQQINTLNRVKAEQVAALNAATNPVPQNQ